MKICAITSFPPFPSGIARYSENLYGELSKKCKIKLFRWNYDTHYDRLKAPLKMKNELVKAFMENDIVHIQYVLGEYMFLFLPLISKIKKSLPEKKLVLTLHEDYKNLPFAKNIIGFHNKHYHNADLLLVHSSMHRKDLPEDLQKKTLISSFGVRKFGGNRKKIEPNTVLMLGFINEWKGHDIAVKAIYNVKKQIPDVKLYIVGKAYDMKYTKKVEKLIDNLGLTENVIMRTEYVPDEEYDDYLNTCEMAIMPYRRITMSAVLSDLIAAKIPTVISDLEQLREYTDDKASYVPVDDSRKLAKEIISVLSQSLKRRQLSEGFEGLARRYSWENVGDFTFQEYKRLLD